MATTSSSLWVCAECGKVCKSRGGLARHSPVHKRHPRVGEPQNDFHRTYHPTFNGMFNFLSNPASSDRLKGYHVPGMENSFHPERHQSPHPQSLMMIGPLSHRAPGLSLRSYYSTQHHSRTIPLTGSSVSGVPRWFLTTTPRRSPTTATFTRQSMPSNLVIFPGNHTPSGITTSLQEADPYPSG